MPILEPVGGAYSMLQCLCGATFCCGDIARRIMDNSPADYDMYFLKKGHPIPKMLIVRLAVLRLANDAYANLPRPRSEFKALCTNVTRGSGLEVDEDTVLECSRYMSIESCCVNMLVKNDC